MFLVLLGEDSQQHLNLLEVNVTPLQRRPTSISLYYSHLLTPTIWALSHIPMVPQTLIIHQTYGTSVAGLSKDLLFEAQCFFDMRLSPLWRGTGGS